MCCLDWGLLPSTHSYLQVESLVEVLMHVPLLLIVVLFRWFCRWWLKENGRVVESRVMSKLLRLVRRERHGDLCRLGSVLHQHSHTYVILCTLYLHSKASQRLEKGELFSSTLEGGKRGLVLGYVWHFPLFITTRCLPLTPP